MGRHSVLDDAFKHLSSRSPQQFWTSGQWMTERKGGSDVGPYVSFTGSVLLPVFSEKFLYKIMLSILMFQYCLSLMA